MFSACVTNVGAIGRKKLETVINFLSLSTNKKSSKIIKLIAKPIKENDDRTESEIELRKKNGKTKNTLN